MKQTDKIHDITGQQIQDEDLSVNSARPDPEVLEKKPRLKFYSSV